MTTFNFPNIGVGSRDTFEHVEAAVGNLCALICDEFASRISEEAMIDSDGTYIDSLKLKAAFWSASEHALVQAINALEEPDANYYSKAANSYISLRKRLDGAIKLTRHKIFAAESYVKMELQEVRLAGLSELERILR